MKRLLVRKKSPSVAILFLGLAAALSIPARAQIGRRFPSEKKIVPDPVTGLPLTFLTSTPAGDQKIYQTHHQWTADGKWLVFRSNRVRGQAMAVNEDTGDIVQVTEGGYAGMLCLADNTMNLYFARTPGMILADVRGAPATGGAMVPIGSAADPGNQGPTPPNALPNSGARGRGQGSPAGEGVRRPAAASQIVRVDLAKVFADSAAGKMQAASEYEQVCGTIPAEFGNVGDVALDPTEEFVYFRVSNKEMAGKHLPADTKAEQSFGARNMGAGPTGLASMNLKTGEIKFIVAVPFQIGHVQTNPWVPGEIIFCWETGGKAPQRTWIVRSDGTGLRPLYPEASYEWITHEAVVTKDEVAIAILAHRSVARLPADDPWGTSGTGEHPTGLGIVNLRTREMRLIGQVPVGNPGRSVWHVNGSPDGRWAVADDFQYRLWLIDRTNGEMSLLSDNGHKTAAQDHQHPTFSADSTRIQIQSAMLSEDGRSLNICIVPVPKSWLERTYTDKKLK
ncbi:MAG: hypothetical protein ABIO94_00200 [Opitutaceae bacterium]